MGFPCLPFHFPDMATSKTQILNLALARIGENRVIDIDDTTQDAARQGRLLYEPTAREVMRAHPWNCLAARQQLAANSPAPAFGWAYSYTLPTQCVRLIKVNGYSTDDGYIQDLYKVEGRDILTDAENMFIEYVEYTDDVTKFDPLLDRAIVTLLASYLASIIPADDQLAVTLRQEYETIVMPRAQRIDGHERNARKYSLINNSSWLASRRIQPGEGTVS